MKNLNELIGIIKRLRDKDDGNAWDLEQTHKSLAPDILNENYELLDAVLTGNTNSIKDELGDMLMLLIEMAQIAEDEGMFTLDDVAKNACDKLHTRLPHFFGDRKKLSTEEIKEQWDKLKPQTSAEEDTVAAAFDKVSQNLPSLVRAHKMFVETREQTAWWENIDDVFAKVQEEIGELRDEIDANDHEKAQSELGDVLMMITSLSVEAGLNPEIAFRQGLNKLETRLRLVEKLLNEDGLTFKNSTPNEREEKWHQAKAILKDS